MHYHLTKYGHEKIHMLVEAETSGKNVRNDLGCNIQLNEIVVKKFTLRRNPSFWYNMWMKNLCIYWLTSEKDYVHRLSVILAEETHLVYRWKVKL